MISPSSSLFHTEISSMFPGQIPYRPSPPFTDLLHQRHPVRRDFGDLAFPQGEELIPHIDALRRILLSSPRGNRTAWMMPFLLQCFSHDGFLPFPLYPFQSPLSVLPKNRGCLPCLVRLWLIDGMHPHSLNPKMYHKFVPADCILYFIRQFPQMNVLIDSFVS